MKVKLSDLIEEYSERNISNKYRPVAVGKYGIRTRESIYSKELAKDYSRNKVIRKGTLTVGMGSSQIDIGILRDNKTYSVSPAYHTYKIKIQNYDYLDFLLAANNARMFSVYANRGSRQGKTLDLKRWLADELEIHDEYSQKRIVESLNKIKGIMRRKEEELRRLDTLVKARFVEMFGDEYTEDKLLNLCTIIDYRGKTPRKAKDGLPFITAKNVKMHHLSLESQEYISKDVFDKVMTRGTPREGDVVFTTEAPLGNVCRIPHFDTKFYVGQRIVTLQTSKLNPAYLEYALSSDGFRRKMMQKSSGSTVVGIRVKLLEQLTVPVPSLELQDSFADFVSQVDKSKFAIQKSLEKTQQLFDSLMQEYFG